LTALSKTDTIVALRSVIWVRTGGTKPVDLVISVISEGNEAKQMANVPFLERGDTVLKKKKGNLLKVLL